jgi:hypothetical protein
MSGQSCPRANCFAPDTGCILGLDDCEFFTRANAEMEAVQVEQSTSALPWSGLALGSADLAAIAALGETRVVGLVGASDAGKTTTLAAAHLARRRSGYEGFGAFAGSYTLMGWHQITRHLQWAPWGQGFPPHTELSGRRTPALLHLALTIEDQAPRHIFYTDVPGEWYARWAFDSDAQPGVNWIVDHADAFILFADCNALAGKHRGVARAHYDALARRLATVAVGRRVVPALSKADIEIAPEMTRFITALNEELFDTDTLNVSAFNANGRSLVEVIDRATAAAIEWSPRPEVPSPQPGEDALLAYPGPTT